MTKQWAVLLLAVSGTILSGAPARDVWRDQPLRFERNQGQAALNVQFLARSARGALLLTDKGVIMRGANGRSMEASLVAGQMSRPEPLDETGTRINYFVGQQTSWKTGLTTYARVRYREVYPGIDLVFYGRDGALEYDFVLQPGANSRLIRWRINGPEGVRISANGDLTMGSAVVWRKPVLFQDARQVNGRYVARGRNEIGLEVGAYDRTRPLVIDPVVSYSTYLGGTGNEAASGVAVDSAGNIIVVGFTTSVDFPVARFPYQAGYGGATASLMTGDAFVAKYSPAGLAVYITYLGGLGDDLASGVAVDASNNIYITGVTNSRNFPTTPGVVQPQFAGADGTSLIRLGDAFVTKMNAAGNQLIYSTFLGGKRDDSASAIAVDGAGNAYVTGSTLSTDFPTAGALQGVYKGTSGQVPLPRFGTALFLGGDAFVAKLNPTATQLVYSTYLGGTGDDTGLGIAADASGNAYVVGSTLSTDFPVTSGAFQTQSKGFDARNIFFHVGDAFVAKIDPKGSSLVYSTYLGGAGDDVARGVAVDSTGAAYVTGATSSLDFPSTANAFTKGNQGPFNVPNDEDSVIGDAFVTKLAPNGSSLVYSTFLGGHRDDMGMAIAVDQGGNAYVSGMTASVEFPVTSDAAQKSFGGVGFQLPAQFLGDAFVSVVNATGGGLLYSSYLGGKYDDAATAVAIDSSGNFYIAGTTISPDFPVTSNALQAKYAGADGATMFFQGDAFVARFTGAPASNLPVVKGLANAASNGGGTVSPGMIFVVYGAGIGPAVLTSAGLNAAGLLANSVGNTRVLFDGVPAPLVYVSNGQSSGIVPYSVAGKTSVNVSVEYNGVAGAPFTLKVADSVPSLFTADYSGSGQAVAFNQDGTVNSAATPAKAGEILVLYGTGEGQTVPAGVDGQIATSVYPKPAASVAVTIGGLPAEILYAGAVPNQVAGLLQLNVRIPPAVTTGMQPVVLKIGANASAQSVSVAVQ